MRRLLGLLGVALLLAAPLADAQTKISALPAGTTLAGTEPIPAVQSSATVATTPAAISTYTKGQINSGFITGTFSGTCSSTTFLRGDGSCATPATLATPVSATNGGTGEAGTVTGIAKANGTSAFGAATNTDVITLWSGTCSSSTYLNGAGACTTPAGLATPVSATNGGTGEAGTLTGILKGNGTSAHTVAVSSDVTSLWSGTCSSGTYLRGDGTCAAVALSTNGTFTATATGFSGSAPTGTGEWSITGNIVCLQFPVLTGTSNSGAFTISTNLPSQALPARATIFVVFGEDNTALGVFMMVTGAASTTFTMGKNSTAGNFTSSGTKAVNTDTVCYSNI